MIVIARDGLRKCEECGTSVGFIPSSIFSARRLPIMITSDRKMKSGEDHRMQAIYCTGLIIVDHYVC